MIIPTDSSRSQRIFVAGHRGMVGAAVCRRLASEDNCEVVTASRQALDLRHREQVADFLSRQKVDAVIFAAARVGGISANSTYPVEFLTDNLNIATATIQAAHDADVSRFVFLGSTCIYPRDCSQPIHEDALLTGPLEPTNEAYALAKIAGLKLCQYIRRQYGRLYYSAMPTNLYGPGDNYHRVNSHVLPALIRRFHEAKQDGLDQVTVWGSGEPRREFLHVDDLADALVFLLSLDAPPDWVNVGTGKDLAIHEVAQAVAKTVGFQGQIAFDHSKPDGTPRKLTCVDRIHSLGWQHSISFEDGLHDTYQSFLRELQSRTLRAS